LKFTRATNEPTKNEVLKKVRPNFARKILLFWPEKKQAQDNRDALAGK
jgi:hypothetical protein